MGAHNLSRRLTTRHLRVCSPAPPRSSGSPSPWESLGLAAGREAGVHGLSTPGLVRYDLLVSLLEGLRSWELTTSQAGSRRGTYACAHLLPLRSPASAAMDEGRTKTSSSVFRATAIAKCTSLSLSPRAGPGGRTSWGGAGRRPVLARVFPLLLVPSRLRALPAVSPPLSAQVDAHTHGRGASTLRSQRRENGRHQDLLVGLTISECMNVLKPLRSS